MLLNGGYIYLLHFIGINLDFMILSLRKVASLFLLSFAHLYEPRASTKNSFTKEESEPIDDHNH